ncbi:hypothetical protein SD72_10580 [Leucobacter komagatae]|uniref:Uncharacterized protein n=1 Tax=Leucobacter komagatae TaxID=55969 RepID=A0A0D0H527_9MICO|nr:hypothetical protein SD72_10580 [Leucobacter komagatae]
MRRLACACRADPCRSAAEPPVAAITLGSAIARTRFACCALSSADLWSSAGGSEPGSVPGWEPGSVPGWEPVPRAREHQAATTRGSRHARVAPRESLCQNRQVQYSVHADHCQVVHCHSGFRVGEAAGSEHHCTPQGGQTQVRPFFACGN